VQHPDHPLFTGLLGAGKRLAPACWPRGDGRSRYAGAASGQALAGTAPVPYSSGQDARARKRFPCVKPRRNALYQFTWQSTIQEAWALSYYRRKRSEDKVHSVALRALANLWGRILYALWRTRVPYEPTSLRAYEPAIFLNAQQAHARPAGERVALTALLRHREGIAADVLTATLT
jgi:Transposase IS116/IS110/IS902 family